ncbi:MAG: hypothetical protein M3335_11000, partial [Actinomycetota bacterium]|nr:hypothetical protein [Actinomycetota bacterium]
EISRDGGDFDSRLLGVLAVLYILGALLLPLLLRTDSSRPADPTAGPRLRVDHAVVAAGDRQRSEHFYASGLGATVEIAPEGRTVFVWPGSAESAVNHLHARGIEIVEGPVARAGAEGVGVSVFCRDPDGGLVELISYG